MVCPPATSEDEARWPRFGLVVVATTSRRDNKDQMIRPFIIIFSVNVFQNHAIFPTQQRKSVFSRAITFSLSKSILVDYPLKNWTGPGGGGVEAFKGWGVTHAHPTYMSMYRVSRQHPNTLSLI
jgi:hypothetical protein